MRLAKHELDGAAEFIDSSSFRLNTLPAWLGGADIPTGLYELPRRSGDAHFFRVNHPLGEAIVGRARARDLPIAEIVFDYAGHEGHISRCQTASKRDPRSASKRDPLWRRGAGRSNGALFALLAA